MSSSSPSSSSSASSYSKSTITQDQFKIFHNIDRVLFSRLLFSLHRDPYHSMQLMAFWIFLEQSRLCRDLVDNLLNLPDNLLTLLANEADLCLNVVHINNNIPSFDVPLTKSITKNRVSLVLLFENRLRVVQGIASIMKEVCVRAFQDLVQIHEMEKNNKKVENNLDEYYVKQQLGGYGPVISPVLPTVMYHGGVSDHHQYHRHHQNQIMMNNILSGLHNNDDQEINKDQQVAPDERTIFLTFSKGYPITESDIRDFIKRMYGDCIEAIFMQEVAAGEQPLYARLVVNSNATMDEILKNKGKAKFSINGKHVWARKYVRKNNKSPVRPSSPNAMI